ncbi:MAG: ROK family protein [Acidobacteriaceae bacterium]|nr:ROK family protein [Acidobacteriaceae bacterium]
MTKNGNVPEMYIGIDLGGTKIAALALDPSGEELPLPVDPGGEKLTRANKTELTLKNEENEKTGVINIKRLRVDTPDVYEETIAAIAWLVDRIEAKTGRTGTVGVGIPGTISKLTEQVKNAPNVKGLNGKYLKVDLRTALKREEVLIANDANCMAVSEATDGAGEGKRVVFGVILGTGCGGGVAIDKKIHPGPNDVAGEWGHNPLPWLQVGEFPEPACKCGMRGCIEQWISGSGVERDHEQVTGKTKTSKEILAGFEAGDADAVATVRRFEDRLARSLAQMINLMDPDVIVIGGGLSNADHLYKDDLLWKKIKPYVFGREMDTPIRKAKYGDASGVRGAAWLWREG